MIAQRKEYAWLTLAHDVRNLLMGVDKVLQVTIKESVGLAPRSRRLLTDTKNNCELIMDMLDDVMDAHRLEKQQVPSSEGPVHISQVIQGAVRLLAFLAEEKKVTFETRMPEDAPVFRLDQYRMMRVMINLLHNAIKFSPTGETIYIDTEIRNGEMLLIRITDCGPGMLRKRLQPVRARNNLALPSTWGLYYCRMALAVMGGELWIETPRTKHRKGTTFSFTLPIAGGVHGFQQPPDSDSHYNCGRPHALSRRAADFAGDGAQAVDSDLG